MYAVTAELVRAYASLFVHCWDYYAVQQSDGSYRPSYQSLTLARLADHLQGCYTLGAYMLDRAGMCSSAVFDADSVDGLDRLVRLSGELATHGIASVVEASRRGGHVWVFLDGSVLARAVRLWLLPYAQRYEVELYPKQDQVQSGGVGNLVRLPLGVHRQSGGWYPFLDIASHGLLYPVGETVAECCQWLRQRVERVQVPGEYQRAAQLLSEQCEVVGDGEKSTRPGRGVIRRWCVSQDITEVIGRYTCLDRRGVGRCPLLGHHYRGDVHPSFQVFGGADPHWYCYTWGRAGDLFDFLCLYHGLSVQEAWERLQQGVLC
jgi:hypothetical protein